MLKLKGILDFSPVDVTKKHQRQSDWKCVSIIKTNCDMDRYYAWFLKKRFNLDLNKNLRGSHITIISDRMDKNLFKQASEIFNGREIEFYLELEPKSNGRHWWLRVYCPDAESIRQSLGLTKDPYFGFHLTIGHANERNIEHSEYILRMCKRFNLISDAPRKSLDVY
jgi:hypothetical protein